MEEEQLTKNNEQKLLAQFENELANNTALKEDPNQLANLIVATVVALDQGQTNLTVAKEENSKLKKRSWWKHWLPYNNNLKNITTSQENLIEAVGQQQQGMQSFLTLIKGVIFLNVGNMKFLLKLTDELRQGSSRLKIKDPTLLNMATGLLDEAVKAAKHQEAQLEYVKKFLLAEIDELKMKQAAQQNKITQLTQKVDKLKVKSVFTSFKWPFIFMFVLNLGIILLLVSRGLRPLF